MKIKAINERLDLHPGYTKNKTYEVIIKCKRGYIIKTLNSAIAFFISKDDCEVVE